MTAAETEREQGLELALHLMGASAAQLAGTTNTLIDNLTAEQDELRATLDAVRAEVMEMLYGKWMPTPHAIERALWPSEETIKQILRERAS